MFKNIAIIAGLVGGAYVIARALNLNGDTLNPLSANNAAYKAANSFVQWATNDPHQTAGGLVHDVMNSRAGLGDNEYSPANGIIVTQIGAGANYRTLADETAEREDDYWGIILGGGVVENAGGAVVGRTVSRGF